MSVPKPFYILLLTLAIVLGGHAVRLQAKTLVPPDDPTQSITYWKPYAIAPDKDPLAAKAQSVFAVLLRAWDSTRLEPSLYVVDSTAGPWAASLADGNILLSRDAIKTCMNFGKERADHLLAFVLAHELAHQRSDDLWHQRFFRLIGAQAPDTRATLIQKLQLDTKMLSNLEQKEAQADHDGLITMASVGYDPYQILDKKDFFTAWVENIWQNSCSAIKQNTALQEACEQAQTRALRTRTQLAGVATQSMLYELGVQSFIAGDYAGARRYFKAYGRDYPSRAVLSALGSTHLAQAVEIYHTMVRNKWLDRPAFYYPMLLDATAAASPVDTTGEGKRAAADVAANQLKREMKQHLNSSIEYFDKAIRLEPNHKKSYLLLAATYLLDGNTFMARGVIQGQYTPKFRQDLSADLLLAMTSALENRVSQAEQEFSRLIRNLQQDESNSPIPLDVLTYTAYYNTATYAEFRGDPAKGEKLWRELANRAKKRGQGLLFRLALNQIRSGPATAPKLTAAPNVRGKRLGDPLNSINAQASAPYETELWLEGEQYQVYRFNDGSRFVLNPEHKIVNAWQEAGSGTLVGGIALGDPSDRPLKSYGIPNRRLHLLSGEYLAYDDYGLAIHVDNDKIVGWFLYNAMDKE